MLRSYVSVGHIDVQDMLTRGPKGVEIQTEIVYLVISEDSPLQCSETGF